MATFQERFNCLLEESELSQEAFGAKIGASRFQVYNWRSGRGEPDSEMMKNIARICNISVSWLLGETDMRQMPEPSLPNEISKDLIHLLRRIEKLPEKDLDEIDSYISFKEYIRQNSLKRFGK